MLLIPLQQYAEQTQSLGGIKKTMESWSGFSATKYHMKLTARHFLKLKTQFVTQMLEGKTCKYKLHIWDKVYCLI